MKPAVKRPPKTLKEKKFKKILAETGDHILAATKAYDVTSRDSARAVASENLRKLSGMEEILEKHGITDDYLAEKTKEGLDATRTISTISGKEANGGTVDFVDVPDFISRHKYLETALKLKDKFPTKVSGVQLQDGDKTISIIIKDYE
jgi:hypothetical protein